MPVAEPWAWLQLFVQDDTLRLIQNAVAARAIPPVQTDGQLCGDHFVDPGENVQDISSRKIGENRIAKRDSAEYDARRFQVLRFVPATYEGALCGHHPGTARLTDGRSPTFRMQIWRSPEQLCRLISCLNADSIPGGTNPQPET
jgi:hypothetical protein